MKNSEVIERLKGGLIVSCQALSDEPLHSSFIMGRMALAAYLGGAVGIRANTVEDIQTIKQNVDLPIIGIIKKTYEDSQVYITPTTCEVDLLMACGVAIIAVDATKRCRPNGEELDTFFASIRKKYKNQLFMADCSTIEEAVHAEKIGFDLAGTTLSGYTDYTKGIELPNFSLIREMMRNLKIPIVAEGGISFPEDARKAYDSGAFTVVVGGAITRPMEITKRFVDAIAANHSNLH